MTISYSSCYKAIQQDGRMRFNLILTLLLCASTSGLTATPRSAIFCQKSPGRFNFLAMRALPNGDLEFGLSKWEGSQNFRLIGVAKKDETHWVYTEREPEYAYSNKEHDWMYVGHNPTPEVTCKALISWSDLNVSLTVDEHANCPGNAGVGFAKKSSRFAARDYRREVTFELDDSETFLSARAERGC